MVTANSSVAGFFAKLGAVATSSPKWEEISTASSSSPFGSKGFGLLMGRELARASHMGKGGMGPPGGKFGRGGALPDSKGLGVLKRLEGLDAGQMMAVGGELQVLFHTLQAMESAKTPDELVKAVTSLLSPEGYQEADADTSDAQGVQGQGSQDDLLSTLLAMMEEGEAKAVPVSGDDTSGKASSGFSQAENQRASPAQQLAELLGRLLAEPGQPQSTGNDPSTALNRLEQLLARILDGHSQEQKGEGGVADALSKMVLLANAGEEQAGQPDTDVQEVEDARQSLLEHRQAVIRRLAMLIGEALTKQEAGAQEQGTGDLLAKGDKPAAAEELNLKEILDALGQEEGGNAPQKSQGDAKELAEFLERLISAASQKRSPDATGQADSADSSTQEGPETPQPAESDDPTLATILKDLLGDAGGKPDAKTAQGSDAVKPADAFSKVVQQLLSNTGDGGQKAGPGKDGGSQFSWKGAHQGSFWQKPRKTGDGFSNQHLFSHALGKTSLHTTQGATAPVEGSEHVEKVAQAIMDTVKQVQMARVGQSHQMNIRLSVDGVHDLDISLTLSGQKEIALSFVADNSQVLHHLNAHAESLKAALQWHDVKVVSLSFNHPETGNHDYQQPQGGFGFHSFAQGADQQAQNGGGFSGFFPGGASGGAEAPGARPQDTAPLSPGGVDDGLNIRA